MSRSTLVKMFLILVLAVVTEACHRRERVTANSCRAPAEQPCSACSIRCPTGQAALCQPGESDGGSCKTPSSCVCR
jgi:hypothetical protein